MKRQEISFITLMLLSFVFQNEIIAQNSSVSWSSFNMGFAEPTSANTLLKSVVGQAFVGTTKQGDTQIESGFLVSNQIITDVDETPSSQLPSTYELKQNYPNPFNPGTTIEFALPKSSPVTLKIFDMLGREVATLVNESMAAGVHKITFDARALTSGVYFYRLEAEGFIQTRRLMFLK